MSPSLFTTTMTLGAAALSLLASSVDASYLQYSTVPGYFLQDDPNTSTDNFDYTQVNFGLISQAYDADAQDPASAGKTQWQRFENQIASMNAASSSDERYALVFIGRHGEGYHNVAESYYGTPAWNCYWSELDGNGTVTWADAKVTPNGVAQAQIAHDFWASQIAIQKQSLPQSYYSSPHTRCLQTAQITFDGLVSPLAPIVKEYLREMISQHTCDRRSSKSYIEANFPSFPIEAGFTENDELWTGTAAETDSSQDVRTKILLDSIFSSDDSTILSFTSHSGEVRGLLRGLGHRAFSLSIAAVIPVLVKIETFSGTAPATTTVPWSGQATCTVPPLTSVDSGCVCPPATSTSSPASLTSSSVAATSLSVVATSSSIVATSSSVVASASASSTLSTVTSSASLNATTALGNSSTTSVQMTTSTVYTTTESTITKCPAPVTNCPVGSVVTSTIALYTTVCPVADATTTTHAVPMTTSVVYATTVVTITKCPATVTNCPVGKVTTSTIALYTTVCPVTEAAGQTTVPATLETVPAGPAASYTPSNGTVAASGAKPSSPSAGIAQPSSILGSGAAQLGSGIVMAAGFAAIALWL